MSKKRIICAGFYRTGSTLQYNAIRLMVPEGTEIIKQHRWKPNLITDDTKVFTTFRRIEDIKKSWRKFGLDLKSFDKYLDEFLRWQMVADCYVHFDLLTKKPQRAIEIMANELGVNVNPHQINKQLQSIKPPTDKRYDAKTALFRNHITSKK